LHTKRLSLAQIITLRGAYSYDALAPDGKTMYVIEYTPGATSEIGNGVRACCCCACSGKNIIPRAMPTKRNAHLPRPSKWARRTVAQNNALRQNAKFLPLRIRIEPKGSCLPGVFSLALQCKRLQRERRSGRSSWCHKS